MSIKQKLFGWLNCLKLVVNLSVESVASCKICGRIFETWSNIAKVSNLNATSPSCVSSTSVSQDCQRLRVFDHTDHTGHFHFPQLPGMMQLLSAFFDTGWTQMILWKPYYLIGQLRQNWGIMFVLDSWTLLSTFLW